jgi:hypothetical protein
MQDLDLLKTCGPALVSMRIRILLSISMCNRIQGAKPKRIHAIPDLDPGQTLPSKNLILT